MLDIFTPLWDAAAYLLSNPRFLAALPALVTSWAVTSEFRTSLLVAFIAFSSIDLIIWITTLFPGDFAMPVSAASGVGTFMGLIGMRGIQKRVEQVNVSYVIEVVVNLIKRK